MTKTVAVIPARGGSKGVPRKNIHPLAGYPLIAWSIEAARLAISVDRVIVSTDDPAIAETAAAFGAEVPFLRPAELAGDTVPDLPVILHLMDWLRDHDGADPEFIVHLRPTTPVRDPALIDQAVYAIAADPAATALRSAHPLAEPPHKMFQVEGGYLRGFFPDDPRPEYYNLPRQTFPTAYSPNGYVDVVRCAFVRADGRLHGPAMLARITPVVVEVDRPEDLEMLEYTIARGHGGPVLDSLRAKFPRS